MNCYSKHIDKIRTMNINGCCHSAYDASGNYLAGGQASCYAYAKAHVEWVKSHVDNLTVVDLTNYSRPPITGEVVN